MQSLVPNVWRVCAKFAPCLLNRFGKANNIFGNSSTSHLQLPSQILLYDLASLRQHALPPVPLHRLTLYQIEAACSQMMLAAAPPVIRDTLDPTTAPSPDVDPGQGGDPQGANLGRGAPLQSHAPVTVGDRIRARALRVTTAENSVQLVAVAGKKSIVAAKAVAGDTGGVVRTSGRKPGTAVGNVTRVPMMVRVSSLWGALYIGGGCLAAVSC